MFLAQLDYVITFKNKEKELKIIYEAIDRQAKLEKWEGDYFIEEVLLWISPDLTEESYYFRITNNKPEEY